MTVTSGQKDAAHRRAVGGAVYALSGLLVSRVGGLPDAPVYWATRTFSGGPTGHEYEKYLGPPSRIRAELSFKPGDNAPLQEIPIPARNLPFRHSESLVTTIIDEDYAWENSLATLWVAYLKPGQEPGDLPANEWEVVRERGQFGPPREIQADGFVLPLISREIVRRQQMAFDTATRDVFPDIDPVDEGRMVPVVVGYPESWIPTIRADAGVYGFSVETVLSGTASGMRIQTGFPPDKVSGLVGSQVYINRVNTLATVASVADIRADLTERGDYELTFGALVDFNIAQGALVQERKTTYEFLSGVNGSPSEAAFETFDGRIVPVGLGSPASSQIDKNGQPPFGEWSTVRLSDAAQPPALIPRLNLPDALVEVIADDVTVTQQPEFAPSVSTVEATKPNVPTGPGFAAAAFDGSLNTAASIAGFTAVSFTFPSVTGGTFNDGDTTRSTLTFTSAGELQVTDGGIKVFANVNGAKDTYTIVPSPAQDFDQTVRFIAGALGGLVYEVAWEHELSTTLSLNRTQDVVADGNVVIESTGTDTGSELIPIRRMVYKQNVSLAGLQSQETHFGFSPWVEALSLTPRDRYVTRPTSVFANFQRKWLEFDRTDPAQGGFSVASGLYEGFIDMDAYDAVEAVFDAKGIELNFALTEPITWPDLEAQLAWQSRCHSFYGPNGHSLVYMQGTDDAKAADVEATFRLPGTPGPNASIAQGSPLLQRTSPADVVNHFELYYKRNWLKLSSDEVGDRFNGQLSGVNAASQSVYKRRYNPDGPLLAWAIAGLPAVNTGDPYDVDAQAQDLADFFADRMGFSRSRFAFETTTLAHGLTRGSTILVAFAVAPGVFRNVKCEVESIEVSPINGEIRIIVARSLDVPQKGLEPAETWLDLFIATTDTWPTRITNVRDRWEQYWTA